MLFKNNPSCSLAVGTWTALVRVGGTVGIGLYDMRVQKCPAVNVSCVGSVSCARQNWQSEASILPLTRVLKCARSARYHDLKADK